MKATIERNQPTLRPSLLDEWERTWQSHWSKVGTPGYELPVGEPGGDERDFLATARTADKERARLKRISDEFAHAFRALYQGHGSLGRRLVEGDRLVTIHGQKVAVKAQVHRLGGFSAHAEPTDLLAWLSAVAPA